MAMICGLWDSVNHIASFGLTRYQYTPIRRRTCKLDRLYCVNCRKLADQRVFPTSAGSPKQQCEDLLESGRDYPCQYFSVRGLYSISIVLSSRCSMLLRRSVRSSVGSPLISILWGCIAALNIRIFLREAVPELQRYSYLSADECRLRELPSVSDTSNVRAGLGYRRN